jgi:hypothetical protein
MGDKGAGGSARNSFRMDLTSNINNRQISTNKNKASATATISKYGPIKATAS